MPSWFSFLFLWFIASVGHVAWTVQAINYLHSTRYRQKWIKLLRKACHLFQITGPFLFLWFWGQESWDSVGSWGLLPPILLGYLAVIWGIGGGYVPWMLLRRWTRKTPVVLEAETRKVVRVAQQLGYKPAGMSGPYSLLARFPGNQIFDVEVIERTLRLPTLPTAWEGLTLLQLTDLHLCGVPDRRFYEYVGQLCGQRRADLLLITGDLVDSDEHYHWLKPMLRHLKWRYGAFAILGNHDAMFNAEIVLRELAELHITPVGGTWTPMELRGERLILIGNEMPWLQSLPDLTACPDNGFRLCLSHSPDQLPWAKENGIDLMLCGHTHGGQIRIPGIGSVFVPSRFGGRYDQGVFQDTPTVMHVSRGLAGTLPVRYFCRPEVTWLTLKSGKPAKAL
jgi:uncharacterized protein